MRTLQELQAGTFHALDFRFRSCCLDVLSNLSSRSSERGMKMQKDLMVSGDFFGSLEAPPPWAEEPERRIREWVAERGGSQERCIRLNLSTITRGPAAATDHLAYASPRPNNNY
eukprot:g51733.t1